MRHPGRVARVRDRLATAGLQGLLVTRPANVRYLSGFTAEEAYLLIVLDHAWIVSDFRYALQIQEEVPGFEFLQVRQMMADLARALKEIGLQTLAFEPGHLTVRQHGELSRWLPDLRLVGLPDAVENLRVIKDDDELAFIRKAAGLADAAMEHLCNSVSAGKSEKELALDAEFFIRREGADDVAFEVIVASGPRAALPHAAPTDRRIEPGDLVIMDLGACWQGYGSDLTRTVAAGKASETAKMLYSICYDAQKAGLAAVRAGAVCAEVDAAARKVVEQAGHGECFGHGLGHGVGLEIHEAPRLSPTETGKVLEAGMVLTVEPAIYLAGVGGVRIEDLVVVGDGGCELLTRSSKPAELPEV
jgi:Xaa-Pro aminopeptidase